MDAKERAASAKARGPIRELELTEDDLEGVTHMLTRQALHKKVHFLRAFAQRGIILDGCEAAGVSRGAISVWRADDEWFDELFLAAMDESADVLEREAFRRAVTGIDEPVIYRGLPTMVQDANTGEQRNLTVKRYSDQLLTVMLKARKPDTYRENVSAKVEHTGQTGVLIVPGPIDAKTWAEQAAAQQAKFAGNTGDDSGA
jgi:hypothetical protein